MKKWIAPLLATLAAVLTSIFFYKELPAQMAIHFNSAGSADNWIDKPYGAFLLPLLILLIPCIIFLSAKLEKNDNKRRRAEAVNASVAGLISIMLLAVHAFSIAHNLGHEIHVASFVSVLVGILFVLLGNLVPRMTQGSMQWPKLPEDIQRKASRFQGRFMMVIGFAFLLINLLPMDWMMPVFFLLIATFILAMFGSLMYYARSRA